MEPVTHFLTGACLGRAGFNRKTAYATLAAVLAAEAADNGLLAPELAASISRAKRAKTLATRTGNWLSQRQAQALLSAPDISALRGLRDRVILVIDVLIRRGDADDRQS